MIRLRNHSVRLTLLALTMLLIACGPGAAQPAVPGETPTLEDTPITTVTTAPAVTTEPAETAEAKASPTMEPAATSEPATPTEQTSTGGTSVPATPTDAVSRPTPASQAPTEEVIVPPDLSGGTTSLYIENTEILTLESFPVQVNLVVSGNFPDGCTSIGTVTQERTGETFNITITTNRPPDQMCTAVLVPFQETIKLDVAGLKAGTYTVNLNGKLVDTFVLASDNVLQP